MLFYNDIPILILLLIKIIFNLNLKYGLYQLNSIKQLMDFILRS